MSSKNTIEGKDSTANLLRLFNVQPAQHVVTRQDLTRDYGGLTNSSSASIQDSDDAASDINHYYTWNSPRTNASIHKERTAIVTTLHSTRSSSCPLRSSSSFPQQSQPSTLPSSSSWPSWSPWPVPSPSKSFTRSYRVQDIVEMCFDGRSQFSSEDYHDNEAASVAVVTMTEAELHGRPQRVKKVATVWPDSEPGSHCWSCTADGDEPNGECNNTLEEESTSSEQIRHQLPLWKRILNGLLLKAVDNRQQS